jgi:tetratricopeptide (TPR) repeat protein
VGWAYYDTNQHGLAQRYYIAGLRAAHTADDRRLGAHILGSMAYQTARQGRPAEAVTLVDTAIAGTRGWQTPALLAELDIRKAYAFATLGDASACMGTISRARTHVEEGASDDDPPYLYWVRPAEITTGAGDCLLQLGRTDQAAALINQGIAMFDAPFVRDRQISMTQLADALARPGKQHDLDGAVTLGMQSLELGKGLDSTRGLDHLRNLYRRLRTHDKVPAVREFLERMEGLQQGMNN